MVHPDDAWVPARNLSVRNSADESSGDQSSLDLFDAQHPDDVFRPARISRSEGIESALLDDQIPRKSNSDLEQAVRDVLLWLDQIAERVSQDAWPQGPESLLEKSRQSQPPPRSSARIDAADSLDVWLRSAEHQTPQAAPPGSSSPPSGDIFLLLDHDDLLAIERTTLPGADETDSYPQLDEVEWRARAKAAAWVFDLPIVRASEISRAVDRLAQILLTLPHPRTHRDVRQLIDSECSLEEIEAAASLKEFWDNDAQLSLTRRYDQMERTWVIRAGKNGLSLTRAARLLSRTPIEALSDLVSSDWKHEWLQLSPKALALGSEVRRAFGSYADYVCNRTSIQDAVKPLRMSAFEQSQERFDHALDDPDFKGALVSATQTDLIVTVAPGYSWIDGAARKPV